MADTFNFDFFQVAATGPEESDAVTPGGAGSQMYRQFNIKMSNFGALNYGLRNADDYTKTALTYQAKDELMNPVVPSFAQDGEYNLNPFVWGSTVKRVRNDEFTVMGLGSRRGIGANIPSMDVMDTNEADASDFAAPRIYPSEGWHYFGSRTAGPAGYVAPGTRA